jgi:hypothetical protein
VDGFGNNRDNPAWGSAGDVLLRRAAAAYGDGVSSPGGVGRPSPRVLSNQLCFQDAPRANAMRATDLFWQWGQFVDHDIDLTQLAGPTETFDIPVPPGDAHFDPEGSGTVVIRLDRSTYDPATGTDAENPRQQLNAITAFIDASNVYGSDPVRAAALRDPAGGGRLRVSEGGLLPFNTPGLPNAGGPSPSLFLAGDVRSNEQVGLTALHTLFMREHNRLAAAIAASEPELDDEEIYQRARALVGAQMQVITYEEFLPVLLGPGALSPYRGYDPTVHPGIANEFSTAAYRVGHTMLSGLLRRLDARGQTIAEGNLPLREAFFAPERLIEEGGIEPLLRGLASHAAQAIDNLVVDDVRNFLFGPPGQGGFDLAALNIQRGRDHGLAGYNAVREAYGLPRVTRFAEITSQPALRQALERLYHEVDAVDLWIGALAEDPVAGALVGPLLRAVIAEQFERLRDGDRFWYQTAFSGGQLAEIEATTLAAVIRRNTAITEEIQDRVLVTAPPGECVPGATASCLNGGRFRVEADWRTPSGASGRGQVMSLAGDSGAFWFFDPDNAELIVKVIDACRLGRFWVFAAGLTHVEVEITVTDTQTGQSKTYFNPMGRPFEIIQDTDAFATCP